MTGHCSGQTVATSQFRRKRNDSGKDPDPLPTRRPFATQAELEQAITQAITTHRQDFFPLLERLVDVGTPGSTSVRRTRCGCLSIELADGREGVAHINYESNFAESCLIINEYDQHQTSLAFRLDGDALIFDVELPIAWNFNN